MSRHHAVLGQEPRLRHALAALDSNTVLQPIDIEETMGLPEIGSMPPAFTLPNQDGVDVSLSDHAGKHVVLWFYPRAFGNN